MTDAVLALNAGSSSIKFALFRIGPEGPLPIVRGTLEDGDKPRLTARAADGLPLAAGDQPATGTDIFDWTLHWVEAHLGENRLAGVGHRIVHGGPDFAAPVRLDEATIGAVAALTPLAPLHQPRCLEPVRALRAVRPDLPQVACFDTAFHHALGSPVSRYAIPREYEAKGIRKYGFHGLSYEFIAGRLATLDPELPGKRVVVAHLGSGASLCAMRDGRSLDTTMGFSVLDGLVMGTRCGSLDPGIVLHLQKAHGLSVDAVEDMLYHRSGLLGVSGIASDMRTLAASDDPHAREALDLFAHRVARETAALATTLGGIDALVFTGGIGEHAADVRADICRRLAWLGLVLDEDANARSAALVSQGSRIEVRIVPTDEEIVIARHTLACLHR